jgi:leucyl-tRNA synthetase
MPGYAGSSWYFLRYMDPHNNEKFAERKAEDYWGQVDLYIGGTEHAVGHLLYSRMWTKALCDLGYIGHEEPYKKLVNQGMIQGSSRLVYRIDPIYRLNHLMEFEKLVVESDVSQKPSIFISFDLVEKFFINNTITVEGKEFLKKFINRIPEFELLEREGSTVEYSKLHADVNLVDGVELNFDLLREKKSANKNAYYILNDGSLTSIEDGLTGTGKFICGVETEKMSKSKYNVVNPDEIVNRFGADTFRMYEMFLGPVEQSKPWDTKGIEGVHRFLRKFWRLYVDEAKGLIVTNESATPAELKVLHRAIKKIEDDTERFSFNTAVSAFMVCVNELTDIKCHKREVLEPLLVLLTPYAPHIAEELYQQVLNSSPAGSLERTSVLDASFPQLEEKYLVESSKEYPISINGKLRTSLNISLDAAQTEVEELVLKNEIVQKWLDGKPPKKIIFVKGKMVNLVI